VFIVIVNSGHYAYLKFMQIIRVYRLHKYNDSNNSVSLLHLTALVEEPWFLNAKIDTQFCNKFDIKGIYL